MDSVKMLLKIAGEKILQTIEERLGTVRIFREKLVTALPDAESDEIFNMGKETLEKLDEKIKEYEDDHKKLSKILENEFPENN